MTTISELLNTLPQAGSVSWIGVREQRRQPMTSVTSAQALVGTGLEGDRFRGKTNGAGKRQVTLIQAEHLDVIASLLHGGTKVAPDRLRRNIAVTGINLLALKDKRFRIGSAVLEYTGLCHPCSRMEEEFGPGGYNAVRGHGGITARVLDAGTISLGDSIVALAE